MNHLFTIGSVWFLDRLGNKSELRYWAILQGYRHHDLSQILHGYSSEWRNAGGM